MLLLFIIITITIIINITITITMTLAIALRNHSQKVRSLLIGVRRTAWSLQGMPNFLFFQKQLSKILITSTRHQSRFGEKQGMSRHFSWYRCFPSLCLHPQCLHVSGATNCSGGHGTWTGILWEKRVFSSCLSVIQEGLPVWFLFMIILLWWKTFKILKLRSCSYKTQKCTVECIKI